MAANLTDEQLDQQVQALQNIDDETLKKFVGVAAVALFVRSIARRFSPGEEAPQDGLDALKEAAETVVAAAVTEEDEFAVEGEL